jgi:hypothetical protein
MPRACNDFLVRQGGPKKALDRAFNFFFDFGLR